VKDAADDEDTKWQHLGHCIEGQPFEISGIDVWSQKWRRVEGAIAEVKDPLYAQSYRFSVYEIGDGATLVRFAAGEYSANVYGFYVPHRRHSQT
jgi:hypothetical protein